MNIYKKNIILVPEDFDGASLAKGIVSIDCYENKIEGRLRCYNLPNYKNLVLGIALNGKLNKINIGLQNVSNFIFESGVSVKNNDEISVVLLDVLEHNYKIMLWGSTILNNNWKSTLEMMLEAETYSQNKPTNFAMQQNYKQEDYSEQVSLLKNENLENFVDDLASIDQQKLMQKIASEQNTQLQNIKEDFEQDDLYQGQNDVEEVSEKPNKKDSASFFDRISYQIDKMFSSNPQETALTEIIPNSKFCKVEFDDKSGSYVFGIIYDEQNPQYLCYGVPAKKQCTPPRELSSFYQWLPLDIEDENGDGYYMMYQDAHSGKNISVEII